MPSFDASALMQTSLGKVTLGDVLTALVLALVSWLAVRLLLKVARKLLSRTRLEERARKYVLTALRALFYLVAAIVVIGSLGIDMTSLVALLSVASLGVTLAAEDVLANVAGGLVILSTHPFAIGDFIEVSGTSGTVEEISLNHTKLITADGLTVMLPNKSLAGSQVTDYTALGRRRIVWKVSASYDAPTDAVLEACQSAIASTQGILQEPVPAAYLTGYGASAIEYTVFCWATAEDYWPVYYALGQALRSAFAGRGVEMTYDHLNVHLLDGEKQGTASAPIDDRSGGETKR